MSERDFFREEAKRRAAASVETVETQTSAEVVVAVRRRSGDYRVATYHFGLVTLALVVAALLAMPETFSVAVIALDGLVAFLAGTFLAWNLDSVARLLVRRSRLQANVDMAARVAFYDLGISRTRTRSGILVFVSTFERTCAVVADIGLDPAALGPGWDEARERLRRAVQRPNVAEFFDAIEALGPVLGAVMPRAADDINELPDKVQ